MSIKLSSNSWGTSFHQMVDKEFHLENYLGSSNEQNMGTQSLLNLAQE
jgi:hypothetical protein